MSSRLRRGNWSVQEMERLRLLLPFRGVKQTAALLRRSPESVQRKAEHLLRVVPRKGAWNDCDDLQLREAWGALELGLMAAMLGRTMDEVVKRAEELRERLKAGPWTREDRRLLKKLYGTRADEDLVVCLMRSRSDIVSAARRMCLAKDKKLILDDSAANLAKSVDPVRVDRQTSTSKQPGSRRMRMPRWTSEEIDRLRELYPNHDNLAVARDLDRSVTSVANKAFQLGLKKSATLLTAIGRSNISNRYTEETAGGAEDGATIVPVEGGPAASAPAHPTASPDHPGLRSGPMKQPLGDQVSGCDGESAAAQEE